jgi:hypothetical protein
VIRLRAIGHAVTECVPRNGAAVLRRREEISAPRVNPPIASGYVRDGKCREDRVARNWQAGWVLLVVYGALGACAGNGAGLDQNGRPLPPGGETGGALTADFASIQAHVFTPICTACHAGGGAPQGLRLDATNSYTLLVGVPSTEVPAVLRVKPGDPDNSYLIQKLEGHAAVGARMPFGGPYLDPATIGVIRQWITDGAAPAAAASGLAFTTTSVTPASHDVVLDARAPIVVGFSQELDRTRIDDSSLRLELLEPGSGAVLRSLALTLSVPAGDPSALIVTATTPLADGHYRLVATASPETGLSAISGARLGGAEDARPIVLTEFEVASAP